MTIRVEFDFESNNDEFTSTYDPGLLIASIMMSLLKSVMIKNKEMKLLQQQSFTEGPKTFSINSIMDTNGNRVPVKFKITFNYMSDNELYDFKQKLISAFGITEENNE